MGMLACPGCGGRNPDDAATCAFCQHPLRQEHRRSFRLAGRWRWPRVALLVVLLLLMGLALVLAGRVSLLE